MICSFTRSGLSQILEQRGARQWHFSRPCLSPWRVQLDAQTEVSVLGDIVIAPRGQRGRSASRMRALPGEGQPSPPAYPFFPYCSAAGQRALGGRVAPLRCALQGRGGGVPDDEGCLPVSLGYLWCDGEAGTGELCRTGENLRYPACYLSWEDWKDERASPGRGC